MVDQEGRVDQERPSEHIESDEGVAHGTVRCPPDHSADRLPPGKDSSDGDRACQQIGAALRRLRDDTRPPALECRAGHDAVLKRWWTRIVPQAAEDRKS